jgi:YesN/AraC family two-component response regulator
MIRYNKYLVRVLCTHHFFPLLTLMIINTCMGTVGYALPDIKDDSLTMLENSYQYEKQLAYTQRKIREFNSGSSPAKKIFYLKEATVISTRLARFDLADEYSVQFMSILPSIKDSLLIAQAKIAMISLMIAKGELDDIHQDLEEILDFALRQRKQSLLRDTYATLGNLNVMNGKYEDALVYAKKALTISFQHPLPKYQGPDQLLLGVAYMGLNNPDSADFHLNKGLLISQQKKDYLTTAIAHLSIGFIDLASNKLEQWRTRLNNIIDTGKKHNNKSIIAMAFAQIMMVELSNKHYEAAIHKGHEAFLLLQNNSNNLHEHLIDSLMYVAHKKQGQTQEALKYYEQFTEKKYKVINTAQANRVTQLKHIHQQKKDALTILTQKLELENRQKKITVLILLNLFILTVVTIIIWVRSISVKYIDKLYEKEKRLDSIQRGSRYTLKKILVHQRKTPAFPDPDDDDTNNEMNEPAQEEDISADDRRELFEAMLSLLETEKLHLDPELSQQTIITKLGTNKKYLYQAISQNSSENFKQLLNELRVREAKQLIEEHIHDLPPNLYLKAGFNSVTSYYRAFKNFTGLSPKEYASAHLKDLKNKRAEP